MQGDKTALIDQCRVKALALAADIDSKPACHDPGEPQSARWGLGVEPALA